MVPHTSFGRAPPHMTPFATPRSVSDPTCLQAAVAAAQAFFADKQLPLVVLGRRVRYVDVLADVCQPNHQSAGLDSPVGTGAQLERAAEICSRA
jgi:hypothetical protein